MAYPSERSHDEYQRYVIQWSSGEGEYANESKMSKEQWLKRRKKDDEEDRAKPTTILSEG